MADVQCLCLCVCDCTGALQWADRLSSGPSYNTIQSVMRDGLHDAVRGSGKEELMERM